MSLQTVKVSVPATTANLGPGFDCLGVALDLWNEVTFSLQGSGIHVEVQGEGAGLVPASEQNLVAQSYLQFCALNGLPAPSGLRVVCRNHIPLGSGMGSSAAAVVAGMLGASQLTGVDASPDTILEYANQIEGHPDNAAAAIYGGLVIIAAGEQRLLTRRYDLPELHVAVALGEIDLPTRAARAALPKNVSLADAVFNISRTALVVEALRSGDLELLGQVMQDRLHQPYRLPLMPGAAQVIEAALQAGAQAAAISGAGPSLIAFTHQPAGAVANAMQRAYQDAGTPARAFALRATNLGAQIES